MPYAVELFLDGRTEAQVRAIWHRLAQLGVSSYMQDCGGSPHVTLAVSDTLDVAGCRQALERMSREVAAIPVSLAYVGFFPTFHGVAFLGAVVTPPLMEVHRRFHEAFAALTSSSWPIYQPERWVPHCTLAIQVPPAALADVTEACRPAALPLSGGLERIGAVEFHAREDGGPPNVIPTLFEFSLRSAPPGDDESR